MSNDYSSVWDDFSQFKISEVEQSDTGIAPANVEFEYKNPAISIDTGGDFVEHNIVGGATVRQRIGDRPLEVDISGVCEEGTANDLDRLRNAEFGTIESSRFPTDSITVHFVSINTSPLKDGGAVKQDSDEFLYTYTLNCVEIRDSADLSGTPAEGEGTVGGGGTTDEEGAP